MSYPIFDIEFTQPLPAVSLSEKDSGMAILLRRKGKPVAFWMERAAPGSFFAPEDLSARIFEKAEMKLLAENIREELPPTYKSERFPTLTIAVCTKDRPDLLARCLNSLRDWACLPAAAGFPSPEILIVDNAPSDGRTQELVSSLPGLRYTCEPRPGLDFARNRAIHEATGELIAFLDDDVVIDRCWLIGLMEAWSENPDAAAFTGLVLPLELATEAQIMFEWRGGFRRGFEKARYHGQKLPHLPLYPCASGIFGAGANMAFRREVLLTLGGFDEALDTGPSLPGGGDLDIWYRVVRAGYPLVYEPQFLAYHQHRRETRALRRQYWSWGSGLMAFVVKSFQNDPSARPKLKRLIVWWFQHQLRQLQSSIRGRNFVPPGMVLAEFIGGIRGLMGEYSRSRKRIEQIRNRFPADPLSIPMQWERRG